MKRRAPDERRMAFSGHLQELRVRLLRSLAAVGVAMALTYGFSDRVIGWIARVVGTELYFFSPTEAFWTTVKVSFFTGLFLALPVVLFELWRFVAPGLLPHERRYVFPFVLVALVFFAGGLAFCYLVVLPFALQFLVSFGVERNMHPMFSVEMYVDFFLKFMLAFGLVFELPLVLVLLSRLGLVTPVFLARNRRYAILLNAILAAILTPTSDVFNMMLMMLPLVVFYELGIIGARLFGKRATAAVDRIEGEA